MASSSTINLFRANIGLSPQMTKAETQLQRASYTALALLLVVGVVVGFAYLILKQQTLSLEQTRKNLVNQINAESTKESMFVAIKDRIGIAEKVLNAQKPLASVLDTITGIVTPPTLMSFAYDEENRIVLSMKMTSIDDAVGVVRSLLTLVDGQRIRSPQLLSLVMEKDGVVRLSIGFVPIF